MQLIKSTLAIAVTATFLTACGGGSGSTTASQPNAPATTASSSSSPATTASQPNAPATTTTTPPTNTVPKTVGPFLADPTVIKGELDNVAADTVFCGNTDTHDTVAPYISIVIPVNINNDGYDDIFVHYWCGVKPDQWNNPDVDWTDTPTPDAIRAYVSDDTGAYTDKTYEVFNEHYPSLGAASRKWSKGDFNNDGIDDYAFATNFEDGRAMNNPEWMSSPVALVVSQPNDTFAVMTIPGTETWGHAVELINNPHGGADVIHVGFTNLNQPCVGCNGTQYTATRYVDGEFVDVTSEYPEYNSAYHWAKSFRATNEEGGAKYIIGQADDNINDGLKSWVRNDAGNFVEHGEHNIPTLDKELNIVFHPYTLDDARNGVPGANQGSVKVGVMGQDADGKDIYSVAITPEEMCVSDINLKGEQVPTVFVHITSSRILLTEEELMNRDFIHLDEESVGYGKMEVFELRESGIVHIPNAIDYRSWIGNEMSCDDINGDGYADFVFSEKFRAIGETDQNTGGYIRFVGSPVVYLGNGTNSMDRVDTTEWPTFASIIDITGLPQHMEDTENETYVHDFNNDGLPDYLLSGNFTRAYDGIIDESMYLFTAKEMITANE